MVEAVPRVDVASNGVATRAQPRLGANEAGMYYDVDAALLSTFRLQDDQLRLTWDDEGRILAAVELTRAASSLASLTQGFYRLWGRVCLERSQVHRQIEDDAVSFEFETSGGGLRYKGLVRFQGQPVQVLLRRLRR